MAMPGTELAIDPVTGYLEPTESNKFAGFTGTKKAAFIELARAGMWPNVTAICEKVGITRGTFSNHIKLDPLFAQHVQELKDALCDNVEADMAGYAKEQRNYLDRITILRAHRPEVYDPAKKVIMQHERKHDERETTERLAQTRNFVDAEIVTPDTTTPT